LTQIKNLIELSKVKTYSRIECL